jgi:proteasome beta subunit
MSLPTFGPGQDPGPSFAELLRRTASPAPTPTVGGPAGATTYADAALPGTRRNSDQQFTHGTTIVAINFSDGVVMAGDRRATEGYSIAHRAIEKVFPADRHSGVSIAGAAGPAVQMVRLFQTELEHYEKVEGVALSLEGKANQLGQMIRTNLPMAMEGLGVIPIFAGYDLRRGMGRIFKYDITGGRYEEDDFHATGSGGRDARTTIKLGFRDGLDRAAAIELAIDALYEAADEDSATGGPDVVRGIYPTVATITTDGFERVDEAEVAEAFRTLIVRKSEAGQQT